jgi:hypothetical protein
MTGDVWTLEALKEHFEALRHDDQRAVEAALTAAKEAVTIAQTAAEKANALAASLVEKNQAASNEWRGAMSDRERDFVRKPEVRAFLVAAAAIATAVVAIVVAVSR